VRWLGDCRGIEEQTKNWDKVIVDRSEDLAEWVKLPKTAGALIDDVEYTGSAWPDGPSKKSNANT
jgi:hypothetical protein